MTAPVKAVLCSCLRTTCYGRLQPTGLGSTRMFPAATRLATWSTLWSLQLHQYCGKQSHNVLPTTTSLQAAHLTRLLVCALAVCCCSSAVLSTVSSHASSQGFPFGSVVEFAVDAEGRPLLATSMLSPHTADLQADGRCSVTVTAPGFKVRGCYPLCGWMLLGQGVQRKLLAGQQAVGWQWASLVAALANSQKDKRHAGALLVELCLLATDHYCLVQCTRQWLISCGAVQEFKNEARGKTPACPATEACIWPGTTLASA